MIQKIPPSAKKYPLYLITWRDAQSEAGWESIEKIRKWSEEDCIIYDIGWIVCESKNYIVITSQICKTDSGDLGSKTKIPVGMILKRQKLQFK